MALILNLVVYTIRLLAGRTIFAVVKKPELLILRKWQVFIIMPV
jgi:hypothetical protein